MKGNLEVVKWLSLHRNEGWSVRAVIDAEENGHLDVVEFLQKHRNLIAN